MIILAGLFLTFLLLIFRKRQSSVAELFGYVWLAAFWLVTFSSHVIRDFVQTDENYFAYEEVAIDLSNRGLWIALNYVFSLMTNDVVTHMRILNLFFLFILYSVSVRVFRTLQPVTIAVLLSYFACVAALNLRDTLVFVALLMLLARIDVIMREGDIFAWTDSKLVLPSILMFLLRPFQLAILLVSTLRWYYLIIAIFVVILLLQSSLGSRYFYNWSWHFQNFEQSVVDRGEGKVDDPRPTPANIINWSARFVLAPVPWTSVERIVVDETYEYGRFDLAVRAAHRIFLYSMFVYLILKLIKQPKLFVQLFDKYSFVIKFMLIFSLIYALFNFGGSHERIKMNLFLSMLFVVDRLREISISAKYNRVYYAT